MEKVDRINGANTWSKRPATCPSCDWCSELDETHDHGWICVNCKYTSYHHAAQKEPMNIIEFFDPRNMEHLKAFKSLQENGTWPAEFCEKYLGEMKIPTLWHYSLMSKIVDAYLVDKLP